MSSHFPLSQGGASGPGGHEGGDSVGMSVDGKGHNGLNEAVTHDKSGVAGADVGGALIDKMVSGYTPGMYSPSRKLTGFKDISQTLIVPNRPPMTSGSGLGQLNASIFFNDRLNYEPTEPLYNPGGLEKSGGGYGATSADTTSITTWTGAGTKSHSTSGFSSPPPVSIPASSSASLSSFAQLTSFAKLATKAGQNGRDRAGSFGSGGRVFTPDCGEGAYPFTFRQPSAVVSTGFNRQPLFSLGSIREDQGMLPPRSNGDNIAATPGHSLSGGSSLAWYDLRNLQQQGFASNHGFRQRQGLEKTSSASVGVVRRVGGSGEDHSANTSVTLSASSGQNVTMNLAGTCNQRDVKFGSLKMPEISDEAAVFYFGILATLTKFAPRFEYTYGGGRLWGIKLTFWGHTIKKPELCETKLQAKAAVSRLALDVLKAQFESWIMPDVPTKCETSTLWNWPAILERYCVQNGIDTPMYTRYMVEEGGFRFEVEISGSSYFGMLKSYRTESIAKNASAHLGLFSTIVNGFANILNEHDQPAPQIAKRYPTIFDPQAIAGLGSRRPADGGPQPQVTLAQGTKKTKPTTNTNPPVPFDLATKKGRKRARRAGIPVPPAAPPIAPKPKAFKQPAKKKQKTASQANKNNNLSNNPNNLNNPNPFIEGNVSNLGYQPWNEEFGGSVTVWNVSARELEWETRNCPTHKERVKKICDLLALRNPEYRHDISNGEFGASEYHAAAFFPDDPFLSRAGAIGAVKYSRNDNFDVEEACAGEAAKYLIKMVRNDMELAGVTDNWFAPAMNDPRIKIEMEM